MLIIPERGSVRRLEVGPWWLAAMQTAVLLFVAVAAWGGWQVWQGHAHLARIQALEKSLQQARAQYRRELAQMRARLQSQTRQLAVYARDLGDMQARLARLDALGAQLVASSSLDAAEFNFGTPPAYGGPRITPSPVQLGDLDAVVARLDTRLETVDAQLAALDYLLKQKRSEQLARPHAWPTEKGWISSRFGWRADPFSGGRELHRGVDIANRFGAPVFSAAHGIVTFAGRMQGFGNMVEVDHGYGYVTRYGHLSALTVHAGEEVGDGQMLGRIGSTGRSTGPHLHYEVHRYGRALNPIRFLPRG
jgi:Membrane proteins related to metalloendopeptidases